MNSRWLYDYCTLEDRNQQNWHASELIVEKIRDAGFKIEKIKMYKLLLEEAEEFYAEHRDQPFYADLCAFMSRMESVFLIVSKQHAIHDFKQLAGDKDPAVAKEKEPSRYKTQDKLCRKIRTPILA